MTREASQGANTRARSFVRDYTIHLSITVPGRLDPEVVDEIVRNVVDASSAREAIATGIFESRVDDEDADIELDYFYVVSATRPEGGIE